MNLFDGEYKECWNKIIDATNINHKTTGNKCIRASSKHSFTYNNKYIVIKFSLDQLQIDIYIDQLMHTFTSLLSYVMYKKIKIHIYFN